MIISPSILAANFLHLKDELDSFGSDQKIWFHLDIMDGHFVPNLTFGHEIVKQISTVTGNRLDAHFMVTNPDFYLESFKNIPLYNFTFHYETMSTENDAIQFAKKTKKYFPSTGVSIKPATPVSSLSLELLKNIEIVLVMSVEPGFGGQEFIVDSLLKIEQLKSFREKHHLHFAIQVDGGINRSTARSVVDAGADNLVCGSHLFKLSAPDRKQEIKYLSQLKSISDT